MIFYIFKLKNCSKHFPSYQFAQGHLHIPVSQAVNERIHGGGVTQCKALISTLSVKMKI